MELIRGMHNIKKTHYGCVATLGNFDGLHLGHQQLIRELKLQAARLQLSSLLITFEPFAAEFFGQKSPPARLTRLREKLDLLRAQQLDRVLCLKFNAYLAAIEPVAFVENLLVRQLGVRYLIVGDDFRFGKNRSGDFALLQRMSEQHGFTVVSTPTVKLDETRVGSSRVRSALQTGNLQIAAQLLGRAYSISGRVVHGDARGRQLGFPTANILLRRVVSPVLGVFAVRVHGVQTQPLQGVANVGRRPTVKGTQQLLEVYLLDFTGTLYGKFLRVEFIDKIRAEQCFASIELLQQQIQHDVACARRIFAAGN